MALDLLLVNRETGSAEYRGWYAIHCTCMAPRYSSISKSFKAIPGSLLALLFPWCCFLAFGRCSMSILPCSLQSGNYLPFVWRVLTGLEPWGVAEWSPVGPETCIHSWLLTVENIRCSVPCGHPISLQDFSSSVWPVSGLYHLAPVSVELPLGWTPRKRLVWEVWSSLV